MELFLERFWMWFILGFIIHVISKIFMPTDQEGDGDIFTYEERYQERKNALKDEDI